MQSLFDIVSCFLFVSIFIALPITSTLHYRYRLAFKLLEGREQQSVPNSIWRLNKCEGISQSGTGEQESIPSLKEAFQFS